MKPENDANPVLGRHLSEDELERYSLEPDSPEMQQDAEFFHCAAHLESCAECRGRLEELSPVAKQFREGTERLRDARPQPSWRDRLGAWLAGPALWRAAAATAGVAAVGVVLLVRPWEAGGPPFAVVLQSARGSEASARAPAGRPLELRLDTAGLEGMALSRVELVDAAGRTMRGSAPDRQSPGLSWRVRQGLAAGRYWVRLYGAPGTEMVREYGLDIEAR